MLTNHSGWTAPFKQPFQAKSALYSILKLKVLKIWDISWEYSATLIARLDGLADKIKIKSFSKTKNLGKKKSANCGTQFWSFFVQLKDFQISFQRENTAPIFGSRWKKTKIEFHNSLIFFCLDFLIKDKFFHTLLCWMVSVALSRSHYTPRRIRNIDVTIVQG